VAVKVLGQAPAVDGNAARRLAREFDVLRTLDHPNVVHVYDAGVTDGYSYLAMELVEGLDLRTYLSPSLDEACTVRGVSQPIDPEEAFSPGPNEPGSDAIRALAAMMDEPETDEAHIDRARFREARDGGSCPAPEPLGPEALAALNRPARLERLRGALCQVAEALDYVHAHQLVHRDLKPSNIMVDDRRQARLMDFGLVKTAAEAEEVLTQTGRVVGTYRYMSPEQAQGHPVDGRSDLYSLGVILYELLSGAPPFREHDPAALWREILHVRPAPLVSLNPAVDAPLAALAERLLEKEPARRCQSAAEVLAALRVPAV